MEKNLLGFYDMQLSQEYFNRLPQTESQAGAKCFHKTFATVPTNGWWHLLLLQWASPEVVEKAWNTYRLFEARYTHSHSLLPIHTPAHKWLYGQNLDSVGSKAQKLTLSQHLGSKDSGVLNQDFTYVSPLLWASHFNIIPPGFTHQLYEHAA